MKIAIIADRHSTDSKGMAAVVVASLDAAEKEFFVNPIASSQGLSLIVAHLKKQGLPVAVHLAALDAGRRCFDALFERGDVGLRRQTTDEDQEDEQDDQVKMVAEALPGSPLAEFRKWASNCFLEFFQATLALLEHKQASLSAHALLTVLEFSSRRTAVNVLGDSVKRLSSLPPPLSEPLMGVVRSVMFGRLRVRSLRAISKAGAFEGPRRGDQAENLVTLLEALGMPFVPPADAPAGRTAGKPAKASAAFVDSDDELNVDSDEDEGEEAQQQQHHQQQQQPRKKAKVIKAATVSREERLVAVHNKAFEAAWVATLKLPMRPHTYKRVLLRLPEHVMPFMHSPARLCDFLTAGYELGGLSSVLALSGLFILMRVHNLDYPNFYASLYRTLQPEVFHAKHRARFFRLLTICLSSPSLPAHVVGAFLKKLNRLALAAPPSGALYVLALTKNVLQKHRDSECMSLILAPDGDRKAGAFDVGATDPLASGALDTSLFELFALKEHYLPTVAVLARDLERKWEAREQKLPMDEYTNHTYRELFELERERKAKKVPLSFYKPMGLLRLEGLHKGIFSVL